MEVKGKQILVCNCEVTMALDGKALARACGAEGGSGEIHTQLCRAQIDSFRRALAAGGPLLVGCTQEAPLFEETRAELGADTPVAYANIRERAGWAEQGPAALPKIAALLAEATARCAADAFGEPGLRGPVPGLRPRPGGARRGPPAGAAPLASPCSSSTPKM